MPIDPEDYTKDELQELAADRDLPVSGTKAELADAINAHDQDADDTEADWTIQGGDHGPVAERGYVGEVPGDPDRDDQVNTLAAQVAAMKADDDSQE